MPVAEGSPLREGRGEAGPGEGAAFAAGRSFTSTFPRRDPERQTPFRDSAHVRMKGGSPWPDRIECKYVGYSKDRFHRTSLRRTPSPRCRSQALPAPPCWKGNSPIFLMQHVNWFFKKRVKSFMMALFFFNIYFGPSYQDLPNIDFLDHAYLELSMY